MRILTQDRSLNNGEEFPEGEIAYIRKNNNKWKSKECF